MGKSRRAGLLGSVILLLVSTGRLESQSEPSDFLALGVRQFHDGDFEAAVFALDSAVRRLSGKPGRSKELAQAYVYLGAAYVGLNHEDAAKGKFREALGIDPELRLSPDEFPPRVIRLFEGQVLKRTAAQKKRGAKTFLILGGLAGAGAVGVAAATSGPPPNRPPTATVGISPEGTALSGVTTMTFTASASDPDGDALDYRWEFGDGSGGSGRPPPTSTRPRAPSGSP